MCKEKGKNTTRVAQPGVEMKSITPVVPCQSNEQLRVMKCMRSLPEEEHSPELNRDIGERDCSNESMRLRFHERMGCFNYFD